MLIAAGMYYGRFSSTSICTTCGQIEETTEWQVPFLGVTYWRTSSVHQTPLIVVVTRYSLANSPVHTWGYCHGSGNGITCALGNYGQLGMPVQSPEVARFVDAIARYHGRAEARKWIASLLKPASSGNAAGSIIMENVPANGFPDRQSFEQWWQRHGDNLAQPP